MKRKVTKALTRSIATLLVLLMLIGTVPILAFAQSKSVESSDSNASYAAGNGMNRIAENLSGEAENSDYAISYLEFSGKTATVNLTNKEACKLIVSIYNEDTDQMIASGIKDIEAESGEASVDIDISEMPANFRSRAFLVNSDYAALCKEYVSLQNTTEYKAFEEKEPEDFPGEDIIVFDDTKEDTDFGVLKDGTVVNETAEGMTYTYDETTYTYTFKNSTAEVKELKIGDIYYCNYCSKSNDMVLIKVKSKTVSGSTVKIVEDTEISLNEVFDFIRVDAQGDYSEIELDESDLGEALSLDNSTNNAKTRTLDYNESNSFSTSLSLEYKKSDNVSISGKIKYELKASAKLIYDVELFGKDYYEFKIEISQTIKLVGIKVEGKIAVPKDKVKLPIPPIPVGPFTLKITVAPLAELSLSIEFSITYEIKTVVTVDNSNGLQKTQKSTSDWDVDVKDKVEIKVGLYLELKFGFGKFANIALSGSAGLKFTGEPTTVGAWADVHHDCIVCLHGDVNAFVEVKLTVSVEIIKDVLEFKRDLIDWTHEWYLFDFHISLNSDGFSCGKGACDNIWRKMTFFVYQTSMENSDETPIKNATITAPDGLCDANGDGKFEENQIKTDENGKAEMYFLKGTHSYTVEAMGYKGYDGTLDLIENEKDIDINMSEETSVVDLSLLTFKLSSDGTYYSITDCNTSASGKLVIPSTYNGKAVKSIGDGAFSYCNRLTSITIPNSVTSIGFGAFYFCNVLTSVTIPDSVTSIGDYAFFRCTGLTSITIPNSVTSIGDYAFLYCYSLTSVTIPNSVTSIGSSAFRNCDSLTSITIPDNVTSIGDGALLGPGLTSINVNSNNKSYSSDSYGVLFNKDKTELIQYPIGNERTSYTIPDSVTSIGYAAFRGCESLTSITIPDSVTSIGMRAFEFCGGLTSITIPDSVTSIGGRAFSYCNRLTSITIPDSVTSIGESLFEDCDRLTSVTIGNSVTSIGDGAFYKCNGLTSINVNSNNKYYSSDSYGVLFNKDKTELIQYPIGNERTSYTIPDSVTSIGYKAFYDCDSLTSVTIPDSVTSIGSSVFYSCSKLTDVYFSGTEAEWKSISGYGNVPSSATVHFNGTRALTRATPVHEAEGIVCDNAVSGNIYMIYSIADYSSGCKITTDNLYYVNQSVATAEGKVNCDYNPKDYSGNLTIIVVGDFGNGVESKTVQAPEVKKANVNSVSIDDISMNYKSSANINPNIDADEGAEYTVKYSSSDNKVATVDENGNVYGAKKGSATITCTVTDSNGNTVTDTCNVKVKYSFFQWIIKIVLFGFIWY